MPYRAFKKIFIFAVIIAGVFFGLSCEKEHGSSSEKKELRSGQSEVAAPEFMLKTPEGKDISLSQFKGKVILLEFWATWCPPCKATIPELTAIENKYREKGFEVFAVSVDEEGDLPKKLSDFAREHGINYTVLIGSEAVERSYNVSSIPAIFLIGKDGNIKNSYMGYTENFQATISQEIERLL